MKKQDVTFSRKTYFLVMSLFAMLVLFYLAQVGRSLIGLALHQKIVGISAEQSQRAIQTLEGAIRVDPTNSRYHHELGMRLHHTYVDLLSAEDALRNEGFHQAETSLKRAVMLNPGDPWNYYELGRLEEQHHGCVMLDDEGCLVKQYFLFALEKSPGSLFLQGTVAGWLYQYDPALSRQLVQQLLGRSHESTSLVLELIWHRISDYTTLKSLLPDEPNVILEFSKFLYQRHLDYESELELQRLPSQKYHFYECNVPAESLYRSPDNRILELGHDDGSAEWRSYLASEEARIKKVICLPENVTEYDEAILKILMNSGVPGEFIASIYLNERLIKRLEPPFSHETSWYEIPFDISLLHGKKAINIYVRVTDASAAGNFLQVMGDRDTSTARSVFNFATTEDLSLDKGIQQGEYMIRLMLKQN